jgi:NAD dependent epimerase/dehydratase family
LRRYQKQRNPAPRAELPPWYGFKADLAIAAQLGIAAPSMRRVKRRGARRLPVGRTAGAAGFIGFHIARQLLAEGRDVVGLDNLNDYYECSAQEFAV